MNVRRARTLAFLFSAGLFACEPIDLPPDGGSTRDAGARDAGPADAGSLLDAGAMDAGATDAGATDAGVVSFAADIAPIFAARCAGCHSWTHGALVGQSGSMMACMGQPLVVAGNPTGSNLYLKITNDAAKCGGAMPLGTSGLVSPETDKIRAWIQAGAQNN